MNIQSTSSFSSIPMARSLPKAQSSSIGQDNYTMVEPPPDGFNPSAPVPGGKWIVGGAAAIGAGALGAYAGLNSGLGATIAGGAAGVIVGGVALGLVGALGDIASLGGRNNAKKYAIIGALAGGAAGTAIGAFASNPVAGIGLGIAAAVTGGYAATAIADEYLPK